MITILCLFLEQLKILDYSRCTYWRVFDCGNINFIQLITAYAAENAKKEVVINETQIALAQLQKDNKLLQEQFETTKKFKILNNELMN